MTDDQDRIIALEIALAKANQNIEQLCSTANTLYQRAYPDDPKGRKVRVEDFRIEEPK